MDSISLDSNLAKPQSPHAPVLLLLALHPAPPPLVAFYTVFRATLESLLISANVSQSAYMLYEPSMLHCTVATLRPSYRGPFRNQEESTTVWEELTNRVLKRWDSRTSFPTVKLTTAAVLGDSVGVLLFEDSQAAIEELRSELRSEVDVRSREIGPDARHVKIPGIVHCTVLRWRGTARLDVKKLQVMFDTAFREAGGLLRVNIDSIRLVLETSPCMRKCIPITTFLKYQQTGQSSK